MPKWLRYLLIGLFAYRATRLMAREDGPNDVFYKLRVAVGVYDTEPDTRPQYKGDERPKTFLGQVFDCPYCLGCYVAPASYALFAEPHPVFDKLLITGAVTGIQSALQSLE